MGLLQEIGYNLGLPSLGLSGLPAGTPWSANTPPNYQNLSQTGLVSGYQQPYNAPQVNPQKNALNALDYNQGLRSGALSGGSPIPIPSVQGAQTSSGGGNGGRDPHINPATGNWDDNYFAQNNQPNDEQRRLAEEQARLELENAMREFDRQAQEAEAQKQELGTQQESILSGLGLERQKAESQATASKTQATQATKKAQNKALSTAQDVERKNRNVLRALGILSSSAAGEMLGKPYGEYQTASADLQQGLVNRVTEIDQWLRERGQEVDNATNQVKSQFTNLIGQINRDMRFNGEQRAAAVQQAQLALRQTMSDIDSKAQAYQQAANQYTSQMLQQIAQIQLYQNPQADVSGILSSSISAVNPNYGRQQVGISQTEEQRRRLSGLG